MTNSAINSLIDQIDQCLPQTQCTLCSYPRCREYAHAIAHGKADINQCPPGGEVSIRALSSLLDKPMQALNQAYGTTEAKQLAIIDEARCIGCKLCINACPVDCIVGATKLMHTVIADDCTGCKLCLPVCPTDCIALTAPNPQSTTQDRSPWPDFTRQQVSRARLNTEKTIERNLQREQARMTRKRTKARKQMQQEILAALKRTKSKTPFNITIGSVQNNRKD